LVAIVLREVGCVQHNAKVNQPRFKNLLGLVLSRRRKLNLTTLRWMSFVACRRSAGSKGITGINRVTHIKNVA
jgi:hypothetical protein